MKDALKRKSEFLGFDNIRFQKALAEANKHLVVLGLKEVRSESLDQGATAIALNSELRVALNAYQEGISAFDMDFSKLFLPISALVLSIAVYADREIPDPLWSQ